ncbi:type III pantothenate kinase [Fulvivirga sp. RKSG066]|uniref:type III pantothenate kinase n=1 Tax=Fulvivirga aurantia TaxID=2529383 RepID=UPI0012BD3AFF|nr:type III pantothenate kinase [Fulvivirga aurantia]MTI22156.1 type III pantothenate kinase [Fulvivirga aurantia]
MINLVIDFGNTRTKAAIFSENKLLIKEDNADINSIQSLITTHEPTHTIISSVSVSPEKLKAQYGDDAIILNHQLPLPFLLDYKTPQTLGLDRIAAVAGAQYLFPKTNCLVIDAGTCITYDAIDAKGIYHGGAISPGVKMRFKALNTFTANLPLVEHSENTPLVGQTTKECLESGVIYGVIGEINEFIRMYNHKFADLQIIICGGDTKFFENRLKADIFASPELVLTGLNRILLHNV